MKCLGILSVQRETGKRNPRKSKISEVKTMNRGILVVVAEFSATWEEIQKKTLGQKRRLFKKGERFLRRLGADIIVPTLLCSRCFEIPVQGTMTLEKGLTLADMPEALKVVLADMQESPKGKTGWIVDRGCRPECLPLLIAMSQKVEFLNIVTDAQEQAEEMGEILWNEYGIVPDVCRDIKIREWENTLLVRLDTGRILVNGMTALRGRKWTLDLGGYQIDLPSLVSRWGELEELLVPVGWCCGKSG